MQAYIYWSTGYAVECAHLNGVDRVEYHPAELFSGKQGKPNVPSYILSKYNI